MSERVWLVRWDHAGEHAKPEEEVAMILPGSLAPSEVGMIVEYFYSARVSTPDEMLDEAVRNQRTSPASIEPLRDGGVAVVCGHNPFLEAMLVPTPQNATAAMLAGLSKGEPR